MNYAKIEEVKEGTKIEVSGFTCLDENSEHIVCEDNNGLYIECSHGHHYLDGQVNWDNGTHYVGICLSGN